MSWLIVISSCCLRNNNPYFDGEAEPGVNGRVKCPVSPLLCYLNISPFVLIQWRLGILDHFLLFIVLHYTTSLSFSLFSLLLSFSLFFFLSLSTLSLSLSLLPLSLSLSLSPLLYSLPLHLSLSRPRKKSLWLSQNVICSHSPVRWTRCSSLALWFKSTCCTGGGRNPSSSSVPRLRELWD